VGPQNLPKRRSSGKPEKSTLREARPKQENRLGSSGSDLNGLIVTAVERGGQGQRREGGATFWFQTKHP